MQERRGGVSCLIWKVAIPVAVETTMGAVGMHILLAVFMISCAAAVINGTAAGRANRSLGVSWLLAMTLETFL